MRANYRWVTALVFEPGSGHGEVSVELFLEGNGCLVEYFLLWALFQYEKKTLGIFGGKVVSIVQHFPIDTQSPV
ncbi:hypothetical protein [Candidatus Pelagisphaera phototrophica]|uniref:hypothetical protein n=1 Tax=Candidatus Pelagisphaera phototrophica TaxID=2684113 RepID=UPI001A00A6AD|nr:hypothetical protein [Candidatus Pelagisphaera phototrophica]QXD30923.1 hypothetical protein GA004_11215 [Candidatus Pelagisphaera phototrophica]